MDWFVILLDITFSGTKLPQNMTLVQYLVHFCQIRIGKIEHWANNRMQYKLNVIKYNRVQMRFNQVQPNSTNSEQPMFSIFSDRDQGLDSLSSVITVFSTSRVFHRRVTNRKLRWQSFNVGKSQPSTIENKIWLH